MGEVRGTLTGRLVELGSTIGYVVNVDNGVKQMTSRLETFKLRQLVEKGAKVEGTELCDGQLIIDSNLFKKLPIFKIVYRVRETIKNDSGAAIGYELSNTEKSDDTHRVDIMTAWKLAADGCIEDVEAHVIRGNNKKVLVRLNKEE